MVKHLSGIHSALGSVALYPELKYNFIAANKQARNPVHFQPPASLSCSHSILVVGTAGCTSCICGTVTGQLRGGATYFSPQYQGFASYHGGEARYSLSHLGSAVGVCVVAVHIRVEQEAGSTA